MNIRIVLVTFPNIEKAREIGAVMVESQLAACVNLLPGVESIYRWQGEMQREAEVLGVFKTTSKMLTAFESRLHELHPYDVPEMVAVEPAFVTERYAKWVCESNGRAP
jgi:periplasmic divalent cation tolerance protein